MNFIIIQLVGFIGLLFVVISFQKDKRSFTLVTQSFAALAFVFHFLLLNAWTGGILNILSAVRAYVFYLRDSKKWIDNKAIMYSFVLLYWAVGLLTWKGYASILPAISGTLECFALWSTDTRRIRWLFLSARPTWMLYDFSVGSYAGLITEVFIVSSLVTAIIRFDILKKKNVIPADQAIDC